MEFQFKTRPARYAKSIRSQPAKAPEVEAAEHESGTASNHTFKRRPPKRRAVNSEPLEICKAAHYDPFLSTHQAAEYCSYHVQTITRAIQMKEITVSKSSDGPRAQYRIRLSELNRWMRSREIPRSKLS